MNTLSANLYNQIKRAIIDARLKPEEKLKVNELKLQYKVGGAPIREALSKLASTGLVTSESQKGFRVAPISLAELEDLYHAKLLITNLMLSESLKLGDDKWESHIISSFHYISKLESGTSVVDPYEWETRNREFHCALTNAYQSKTLHDIEQQLFEKTQRYRHLWSKNATADKLQMKKNNQEHEAMLQAALARDAKKIQRLNKSHTEKSLVKVRELLF